MGSVRYKAVTAAVKVLVLELVAVVLLHQRETSHSRTAPTRKRAWLLLGSWALKD